VLDIPKVRGQAARGGTRVEGQVVPRAVMLAEGVYVVALHGTAVLAGDARAWARADRREWRSQASVPGVNLMVEVPRTIREGDRGTLFETAIYPGSSGPGEGPALWSGRYWVRNTTLGPVLEDAE
jgi:hypothetical protein